MRGPELHKRDIKRFVRFRLRTLMIATTVFAVWFGLCLKAARDQEAAVSALTKVEVIHSRGSCRYAYEFDRSGGLIPKADPPGPNFLYRGLGQHFFASVVDVSLDGTRALDTDLDHLLSLPHVTSLDLEYTSVTNSGLAFVTRHFPNLIELDVQSTKITSDGLKQLASLSHIRFLRFGESPFLDDHLVHLAELTTLEQISMPNAQLDGSGLRHLESLNRLEVLDLRYNPIQDSHLLHLAKLTALQHLALNDTAITDDGVAYLCQLSGLTQLNISSTSITKDGVRRIQQALPKCSIKK